MSEILQSSAGSGAGERLFLSEELSDVAIYVKSKNNEWRFPAHRLVLSAQSPVFQRMLESEFAEKATGKIVIQDTNPKIFELLLRAIYQGKVIFETWRDGLNLLHAAHKYQIESTVRYCATYLENVLNIYNVCYIYNESCIYSLTTLKEKSLNLILEAGFIILRSKSFDVLHKEAIVGIIENPNLNIDNELLVFEALLRWARMECCCTGVPVTDDNVLLKLSPFLKYVCFDDMSDTEKSALPPTVLSNVQPNNLCRITYNLPNSLALYSQHFNFFLDQDYSHSEFVGDNFTCIRFSLDNPRFIIGLRLVILASDIPHHLQLTMVKESSSKNSMNVFTTYSLATTFSCSWREGLQILDLKQFSTEILFRQPLLIDAHTVYTIHIFNRHEAIHVNKSKLYKKSLTSEKCEVTISLHSETVWAISGLLFI